MDRLPGQPLRGRWLALLLALVFLIGLALGLLLARVSMSPTMSDTLTRLTLVFLGLSVGAALVGAGWLLGAAGRRNEEVAPGTTRFSEQAPLKTGQSEKQETDQGEKLSFDTRSTPEAPGRLAEISSEPLPTTAAQPPGMLPGAPASIKPEHPAVKPAPRIVVEGEHITLLREQGKWILRTRDILGYESWQMTVGVTSGWFRRTTAPAARQQAARSFAARLRNPESLSLVLFIAAIVIYAFTRLFALERFPINFFADEAFQVTNAMDLMQRGFRDAQGQFLPVYFKSGFVVNPNISVYLHVLTVSLFGKSIEIARGTSAMLAIIAAGTMGLTLKRVFRIRYWWAFVLLMGIMPTWLLFSRTAFDTVAMSSFYLLFIACYLLYRYHSPRYLYLAVLLGIATFYAYPSGQAASGLLAVFLLVSDLRYHLQQRRFVLWAIPLLVLAIIPFIGFQKSHPNQMTYHLQAINSFWAWDIPLREKLLRSAANYLRLLSPGYWFFPNTGELMRHQMKGYGSMALVQLPLLIIGVILCLRHFKESKYRIALVTLLVAPIGATILEPGILRTLAFFGPAGILCTIGLEWLLNRLRTARVALITSLAVFVILGAMNFRLLNDALTNGPTWYSDYTLYGMQWGTKQLFVDEIPKLLEEHPEARIYVTHTWANGTDVFLRFFDLDPPRVQVAAIDGWIQKKLPLDPDALFIMTPGEYEAARVNPKFTGIAIEDIIPYPDGRPGFYVGRVAYADNVDAVFAAERDEQRQLVTESVTLDGQEVQISHTKLDMGNLQVMFDGKPSTVARGVEANPLILDLQFPTPRALAGLTAYFGKANMRLTARLYADVAAQPVEYTEDFWYAQAGTDIPAGPPVEMNFVRGPETVTRLYLEIAYPESDETAHGHIFDMILR